MESRRPDFEAWIDGCLADVGAHRKGASRGVRSWERAELVTFDTDRGRMWAKAVPEIFAHEVAVTLLLADIDPGCVPPVVAADRGLGRIITEHVEGPLLATLSDRPDAWAATLSRLAEIQRVVAAEPSALVVAGVASSPMRDLADAVPRLVGDDDVLRVGRPDGLTRSEAASLRGRIPAFVEACDALAASGVPDSLEHGDLTADEVILGEMGPVFLDWSDGSITHPFLSAASLLAGGSAGDDAAAAYLGPWITAGFIDDGGGRAALDHAATVLPVHLLALHVDRILPALGVGAVADAMVIEMLRVAAA